MVKQQQTVNYSVLKNVIFPADIRKLDIAQLNTLAQEIRELIINTVALSGGHLAASLGTVELTLALHYVLIHRRIGSSGTLAIKLTRIKLSLDAKINLPLCADKTVSADFLEEKKVLMTFLMSGTVERLYLLHRDLPKPGI